MWNILSLSSMKRSGYIAIGVFVLLLSIVFFVVFRASGSEEYEYIKGCTPVNVVIKKGEDENTVDISWETREKCMGYILYGYTANDLNLVGIDLKNEISSKKHYVVISNLVSTKRYYFTIISDDVTHGKNGLPIQFSINSL